MIELWLFLKSKVGQYVLMVTGLLAGILAIYAKGRKDQKQEQITKEFTQVEHAKEINNEIQSLDDDSLRKRAARWVRSKR